LTLQNSLFGFTERTFIVANITLSNMFYLPPTPQRDYFWSSSNAKDVSMRDEQTVPSLVEILHMALYGTGQSVRP